MVRIKFAMSWWAYTFPLAAFTSATGLMGQLTELPFFHYASQALYIITFAVIAALTARTIIGLIKCEICQPD
jgi:tellurite resistance protein